MSKTQNDTAAEETKLSPQEMKQQLTQLFADSALINDKRAELDAAESQLAEQIYALVENSEVYPNGPKKTGYKATKRTNPDTKIVKFYLTMVKPPKKKKITL